MRPLVACCLAALVGLAGCREFASYGVAPGSDVASSDVGADQREPVDLRADGPVDGPADLAGERPADLPSDDHSADLPSDAALDAAVDQATADQGRDMPGDVAPDAAPVDGAPLDGPSKLDSSPPPCSSWCSGCCEGQTCFTKSDKAHCGSGGAKCNDCSVGDTDCRLGACQTNGTCAQINEPNGIPCASPTLQPGTCQGGTCCLGCVKGNSCLGGSDATACGTNGSTCSDCSSGLSTCETASCVQGACTVVPQPAGSLCTSAGGASGQCDNSGTCCTGCIDVFGKCQPGTSISACGTGGGSCAPCSYSFNSCKQPTCNSGVCGAKNAPPKTVCKFSTGGSQLSGRCDAGGTCCLGCLDAGNICRTDDPLYCGRDGENCKACLPGSLCRAGRCTAIGACGACSDGCCNQNSCLTIANQSTGLCGTGGYDCVDCGAQRFCKDGTCQPGSCSLFNCANGCCSNGACVTASHQSDRVCGRGGAKCEDCQAIQMQCGALGCYAP